MNPENTPAPTGDTFSYKGWLNSDSFLKRAFAVLGYNFVAGIILYIPFVAIMIFVMIGLIGKTSMSNTPFTEPQAEVQAIPEAKLDIDAICDNSLAYTTFPDSASTDAYLTDCKAGKYPDVIENYQKGLEMEDGTILE